MKNILRNQAGFGRKGIIIASAVVAALLIVLIIVQPGKKDLIKIGAIIPLSGPAAHHVDVMDAMLLAAKEINKWGGINGKKIEFVIEDSKTSPVEGKKAFNRIEAAHHPFLYVATTSTISMALAPLAEKNEVVLVGLVVTTPALTKQKKWVFRYFESARSSVPAILSILSDLNVKNLGILYQNDEYGRSIFKLLKQDFEKPGRTVKSESFELKTIDYKEQIERLKDMDAIYAVGFESRLKNVFRQLKEKNFRGYILGGSGASGPSTIGMHEANGVYVTAPIIYNPNFIFAKELKKKYEDKYNKLFTQYAANGYDFVKLLAGLLEGKKVSRRKIKSLLEGGFVYSGVFGSINVKPGEHDMSFPLHPARIIDGKLKYLQ